MCGLIGAIVSRDAPVSGLDAGLAALRHRGPNHQDRTLIALGGRDVWLGHTRLSVIDLSQNANQPMHSDDGRFVLVFNGEIYNYIELRAELRALGVEFRTTSDTEVLLKSWAQWGQGCLERLDGMYAFVVLDTVGGTLTCVRDPFGIKPFFHAITDGGFYFASELPAILRAMPSRVVPNLQRAYDYLVHGDYDSSPATFIDGIEHLMPGHLMVVDVAGNKVRELRHWWRPAIVQTSRLSFADAADSVREQFLGNIRRQLRSDVPLGAALSGGIDSSAVVCAIRHLEPDIPIHTFSFVASNSDVSEEFWIDLVNSHADAIPHKVHATAADFVRDIDDVVAAQGEPFGSTSIYAQYGVFRLARENGITVTLDGQGADELLAGYSGYPGYRVLSLMSEGRALDAFRFVRAWHQWPGRSYKAIGLDVARTLLPDATYARVRSMFGRDFTPAWLNVDHFREAGIGFAEPRLDMYESPPRGRTLMSRLASSLQYRGLPSLLRHGDRNSMRFSIESRVPFLSTQLCQLLYSLPEDYLISKGGETKSVFRAAMRGIVPDRVLDRKDKIGFATPEWDWFEKIAPIARGWLQESVEIPFLHRDQLVAQFNVALQQRRGSSWELWRLVNYVKWWNLISARS